MSLLIFLLAIFAFCFFIICAFAIVAMIEEGKELKEFQRKMKEQDN